MRSIKIHSRGSGATHTARKATRATEIRRQTAWGGDRTSEVNGGLEDGAEEEEEREEGDAGGEEGRNGSPRCLLSAFPPLLLPP